MAPKNLRKSFNLVPHQEEIDLFVAAAGAADNAAVTEFLGKYRSAADSESTEGQNALINAAINGNAETVSLLLEGGADIEARTRISEDKNSLGRTALLWAVEKEKIDVITLLLEKGADINVQDNDGWTPLMYVAMKGNNDMAVLLLEKGASVLRKTSTEAQIRSDLAWAEDNGNDAVKQLVLENEKNGKHGMTSIMLAQVCNHPETAELLQAWGDRQEQAAIRAHIAQQQERLKQLARSSSLKIGLKK